MSDGAIVASMYLLGVIGVFALLDFAGLDWELWWIPAALFWPLAVPLCIPLAGVAWVIELIANLLYYWCRGEWPK